MSYVRALGINLGMGDAQALNSSGGVDSFADLSDPISLSLDQRRFNAPHVDQIGWLDDFPGSVVTVQSDGVYDIYALDSDPLRAGGPQILKIWRPRGNNFFYLSFRQPSGNDDGLSPDYTQGVNIHVYDGMGNDKPLFVEAFQLNGESYDDPANPLTVTQVGLAPDNSHVTVQISLPVSSNRFPRASADSASFDANTFGGAVPVLANDSDPDGDSLFVSAVTQGLGGSVTNNGSSVTYQPNPDYVGTDHFEYIVTDNRGGYDSASVTVTVGGGGSVNNPPVANNDSASTTENSSVTIGVLANDSDPDGDTLSVSAVGAASNGSVTRSSTSVTYTPNTGFSGTDSFTYWISDGNGGSDSARVTVTVSATGANEPPVAVDDIVETVDSVAITFNVLSNDRDPEGGVLTLISVEAPSKGTVSFSSNGNVTYTPRGRGRDRFSYTVRDSAGNSASALISVSVKKAGTGPGL